MALCLEIVRTFQPFFFLMFLLIVYFRSRSGQSPVLDSSPDKAHL